MLSRKDPNLNGTQMTLEREAAQWCGKGLDIYRATRDADWRWNGPEVIREYPPNSTIEKVKPDGDGVRAVQYKVRLT